MRPSESAHYGDGIARDPAFDLGTLSLLVADSPVGIAFLDREYRYRLINRKLADLNDVPLAEHIGRSVAEVLPHRWSTLQPIYDRVLSGEAVTEVPLSGRVGSRSEEQHWQAGYYPIRDAAGDVLGVGVVVAETTERVRAEARELSAIASIRASEAQLRAVLTAIPDFIFTLAPDGTHLDYYAPRTDRLFVKPESFIGRRIRDVLPAEAASAYEAAIAGALANGGPELFEYSLDFGADVVRTYDARMVRKSEAEVVVIVRDVTDVKSLERQLRHAQKMEAIGQLAGGVAHDFNNLLTVINGYSEMLQSEVEGSQSAELVAEIRKAGERAAVLTRQLLLFSRQQRVEPRVMSLNAVVSHAEKMLRRLIGERVELITDLDPDVPAVRADPGQIEQVIVNLSVNARDAMPSGGRLTIATRLDAGRPGSAPSVVLSVRDSGTGMEPHVRDRVFEPFFTTKPPGQGTGLGLAVVFGVVEEYGGAIDVVSVPGAGTSFELRFPAVGESVAPDAPEDARTSPRGSETILLVEDDPAVRALALRALTPCGYRVIEAGDGAEALRLADEHEFDLVISDVVLPHLSGSDLMRSLRERGSRAELLFISGYNEDALVEQTTLDDELAFLQKPFSPSALATRVRALLDRRSGGV